MISFMEFFFVAIRFVSEEMFPKTFIFTHNGRSKFSYT